MKRLILFLSAFALLLILAACGADEKAKDDNNNNNTTEQSENSGNTAEKTDENNKSTGNDIQDKIALLKEPDENTVCEMCNMKVYEKTHEMGKFSAQAIKADGSNAFYDDIGCLLNAEIKFNEKNDKFVRDFNTLEWILVDDATIVKTDLKTPMNWGYAFFKSEEDAKKYIEEHEGAYIEKLETVKQLAKERYEAKMKKEKENNSGNMDGHNHMEEQNQQEQGHNHSM